MTEEEINSISDGIGVEWELVNVSPGENKICHTFSGQRNIALNCISKVTSGNSFKDLIASIFDSGLFFPDAKPLTSSLNFEDDFAVYGGTFPNGDGVYDLVLYKNNLFYWISVILGSPVGYTVEDFYKENQKVIDTFLNDSITINLERSK